MELTKDQIELRIQTLTKELQSYGRTVQEEINAMQGALQNKVREAQKHIDNLEGKIWALVDLKGELYPEPKKDEPKNIVALPDQKAPKPEGK